MDKLKKIFNKPFLSLKHILTALMAIVLAILSVMAVISVAVCGFAFAPVGDITVSGENPYDEQDLIDTAGIRLGRDLWMRVDTDEVEKRLLLEHKLLESVKVTREFPNVINIDVVPKIQRWYMTFGDFKYGLDSDLVVIDEVNNTKGLTEIILPNVSTAISGEVPLFCEDNETEKKIVLEIIQTVRTSDLFREKRITKLDISTPVDIKLEIDGKFTAEIGGSADLDLKLVEINEYMEREEVKNSSGGSFYAYDLPISFSANKG